MIQRFDFGNDILNSTIFRNNKRGSMDTLISSAHKFLLPPYTVIIEHFLVCVSNESERKLIFIDKILMLLFGISTYP